MQRFTKDAVKVSSGSPAWRQYGVAVLGVLAAWLGRTALTPSVGPTAIPFIFFFPSIAVAAWFGGLGPGLLAIVLSAAAAIWFFMQPLYSGAISAVGDLTGLVAFLGSSGVIVAAIEAMHASRRQLAHASVIVDQTAGELAKSRDLLSTTLASIGDAVIATDAAGRVTFINAEAERLTRWNRNDAVGQPLGTVFNLINEATGEPLESLVERVLREGKAIGLANHSLLIAKDGARTPIDDTAAPIRNPDSTIAGVVIVFRDVTAQRADDLTRAHLAAVVQYSGDAILTKNLDGIIQTWNAAAERLFGYRPQEIVGRSVTTLIPPDRLHEETAILDRLRRGQPSERLETIRIAKDGRLLHVSVSISPLRDRDGQIVGASKVVHDVTAVVSAREALLRERELLATTLASIGDGVVVTDADGRITSVNRQAEQVTGWTDEDARGRPLPEVFRIVNEDTRESVENPVAKVLRLGTIVGLANHTVLIRKDGEERPIDDSAAPIRRGDGSLAGVVLVFRDVTARREAENAIRTADRRKDEFLAILSHELRNPLAPIRMAISMLQQLGPPDPRLRELRDVIDRQTQQLTRLLDDLLDISRIASGKITLRKERVSVSMAVSYAVEAVRPYTDAMGHSLTVNFLHGPIEVEGDLGRLAQVFTNLLNNAAKYTEKRGDISITVARDGPEAVIRIRDTGIGLAPNQLTQVFELFAQIDPSLERGAGGLGVGLSLAKTFVDLHNGTIEAFSEGLGRGSEFVVRLPALPSKETARDVPSLEAQPPAPAARRILVADDNADAAMVLAESLRLHGHEVHTAHDGPTAIEAAKKIRPDVVILDIGMPRVNGYDVARHLRTDLGPDAVLIAVTGWGQEDDRRRALEVGFNHHLTKPVDLGDLWRLIDGP